MRNLFVLILLLPSFCGVTKTWFKTSSPLNQAHEKLLDNDLKGSFDAMIQVWQSDPTEYVENHLNELLQKTLENDCGKSIATEPVAPWIRSIIVKRQSIQSPGRTVSRVIAEITSETDITGIRLLRWPDTVVSKEANFEVIKGEAKNIFRISYELNQRLPSGLYRLEVNSDNNQPWHQWIVMGESVNKEVVRWESKDSWAVDRLAQLNPYCTLPVLTVSLYDYIKDEYVRVWNQEYEGKYPTQLPISELKPDRYVLAVGITHHRWQGPVIIEDQQVISKTYDISSE